MGICVIGLPHTILDVTSLRGNPIPKIEQEPSWGYVNVRFVPKVPQNSSWIMTAYFNTDTSISFKSISSVWYTDLSAGFCWTLGVVWHWLIIHGRNMFTTAHVRNSCTLRDILMIPTSTSTLALKHLVGFCKWKRSVVFLKCWMIWQWWPFSLCFGRSFVCSS